MDGKRENDSVRRFFIAKGLPASTRLRQSMLQAGVFSARALVQNTMASFVSAGAFSDRDITCIKAQVEVTRDGGVLLDALLDTALTIKAAYVIGFAFRTFGFGDGGFKGFGFGALDGHRLRFHVGSSWLKDHWNAAIPEGVVFELIATTDVSGSPQALVDSWTRLFPVSFHYLGDSKSSPEIDAIIAAGGDPFEAGDGGDKAESGGTRQSFVGVLAFQAFAGGPLSAFQSRRGYRGV